jgi:hypothetical protein
MLVTVGDEFVFVPCSLGYAFGSPWAILSITFGDDWGVFVEESD